MGVLGSVVMGLFVAAVAVFLPPVLVYGTSGRDLASVMGDAKIWSWESGFWADVMRDAAAWLLAPLTISLGLYVPVFGQSITKPPPDIREATRVRIAQIGRIVALVMVAFLSLSITEVIADPTTGPKLVGIAMLCLPAAGFGIAVGVYGTGTLQYRVERARFDLKRLTAWRRTMSGRRSLSISPSTAWASFVAWCVTPLLLAAGIAGFVGVTDDHEAKAALLLTVIVVGLGAIPSTAIGLATLMILTSRDASAYMAIFVAIGCGLLASLIGVYYFSFLLSGDWRIALIGALGLVLLVIYLVLWAAPAVGRVRGGRFLPGTAALGIAYNQTGKRMRSLRKALFKLEAEEAAALAAGGPSSVQKRRWLSRWGRD